MKMPHRITLVAMLLQQITMAFVSHQQPRNPKQIDFLSTSSSLYSRFVLSAKGLDATDTNLILKGQNENQKKKETKSKGKQKSKGDRIEHQEPCNVVFTHTNADFDTLAAAVALSLLWSKHEKPDLPTHVVLPRGVHPVVQRFLAFHKHLLPLRGFKTILGEDVHAIGVVDAQSASRIGRGKAWLDTARSIHVFDHHDPRDTENQKKKKDNSLVDMATEVVIDSVGSTTTLLVERLRDAGIKPKPHEATLFVLGIRADTGGLVYESTTTRDAAALLWCLENGASQVAISEFAVARIGEEQRNILNIALQKTQTDNIQGLRVSTVLVGEEEGEDNEYVAGLAQVCEELLDLTDSHVFVLGATHKSGKGGGKDKAQWVSLIGRASPRAVGVDLNKIMRSFGGGGHPKAAAAAVRCEISEAKSAREILTSATTMVEVQIPEQLVASSVMVPVEDLITISIEDTVSKTRQIFDEKDLKSAPVVDLNTYRFRGSLKLNDLVKAMRSGRSEDKLRGMLRSTVTTILPDAPLAELEELLVEKGVGRIPVVDEEGILVGLVTRTDVLRQRNLYATTFRGK
jgi:tRNA nucleotidyltransferase (CCA-adding enzyme)